MQYCLWQKRGSSSNPGTVELSRFKDGQESSKQRYAALKQGKRARTNRVAPSQRAKDLGGKVLAVRSGVTFDKPFFSGSCCRAPAATRQEASLIR